MYEIKIRDNNLNIVGEVREFTSLKMKIAFCDVGVWELQLPAKSREGKKFLELLRAGGGKAGIVVFKNQAPIFSGVIRGREKDTDYSAKTDELILTGNDDNFLLSTRLAVPKNTSGEYREPYNGEDYSVFTGAAETVIKNYVRYNAADLAYSSRKIAGLVVEADQGRGATVTGRARFDNLRELCYNLAIKGGLGFKTVQSGNGQTQFIIFEPENKTDSVVFSNLRGTLRAINYQQNAATANFIIAGGGGEGAARKFSWIGDEPSRALYGTIEEFIDQRHTTDTNELNQAINEELAQKTEEISVEIKPGKGAGVEFGIDYNVGDKVTVEVDDEIINDIVREVTIELTKDKGEEITPVIGTAGVGTTFRLFDNYRNLEARMRNLEKV